MQIRPFANIFIAFYCKKNDNLLVATKESQRFSFRYTLCRQLIKKEKPELDATFYATLESALSAGFKLFYERFTL